MNKVLGLLLSLGLSFGSLHAACTGGTDGHTCVIPTTPTPTCQTIRDTIQQNAIAGDTVEIPAVSIVCTDEVAITIPITLKGQTTVNKTNGSASGPTGTGGNDATIITRQFSTGRGLLNLTTTLGSTKPLRITGITFRDASPAGSQAQNAYITLGGYGLGRIDNCHFQVATSPQPGRLFSIEGGARGVIDHNYIEAAGTQIFQFRNGNSPSSPNFGQYAWTTGNRAAQNTTNGWGSRDFFFLEDNYIFGSTGSTDLTDGDQGPKFVIRHNHIFNYRFATHGTEPQPRGQRAVEMYLNDWHSTRANFNDPGGSRNGGFLFWGNTYDFVPNGPLRINCFRNDNSYNSCLPVQQGTVDPSCVWEGANGRSPWDVNETEGLARHNGTQTGGEMPGPAPAVGGNYNEANHRSPWQYYPANARTPILPDAQATPIPSASPLPNDVARAGPGTGQFTTYSKIVAKVPTATPSWTPTGGGEWNGFSIINLEDGRHNLIKNQAGQTATANSVITAPGNEKGYTNTWADNSRYQIYKVLVALDQPGRGAGELIDGPLHQFLNKTSGKSYTDTRYWPHEVIDPCYSWNNRSGTANPPTTPMNFSTNASTVHVNVDYYMETAPTGSPLKQNTGVGVGTTLPAGGGVHGFDIAHCTPTVADYATNGDAGVPGTGFWDSDVPSINGSSDTGALYVWFKPVGEGSERWVLWYQPYEYPHPCAKNVTCTEGVATPRIILTTAATFFRGNNNSVTLDTQGFTATPNVWALVSGSLPTNVSFNTGTGTFSGTANTATVGNYNLVVRATNTVPTPDEVSADTNFTLTVSNQAPDITLAASNEVPLDTETVTFTATTTPHGGATITKVEFFEGNNPTPLATDTSSPYTHAQTFTTGAHSIYAVVTDSLGATGTSNIINMQVSNTNPVTVAITSPVNGDVILTSSNPITISADASTTNPGGINNVKFLVDGTVIAPTGGDTTSPYSTTATLAVGGHSLTAKATDAVNTLQTSSPVAVTVATPTPPPGTSPTPPTQIIVKP